MTIWYNKLLPTPESLPEINDGTLVEHLDIRITEIGENYLRGTMPVDGRTRQPYGLLHGGASVALAETLASVAGALTTDPHNTRIVGLDINANHLRPVTQGLVTGTAKPLHLGRKTQVWGIDIVDDQRRLICVSRMTAAILEMGNKS